MAANHLIKSNNLNLKLQSTRKTRAWPTMLFETLPLFDMLSSFEPTPIAESCISSDSDFGPIEPLPFDDQSFEDAVHDVLNDPADLPTLDNLADESWQIHETKSSTCQGLMSHLLSNSDTQEYFKMLVQKSSPCTFKETSFAPVISAYQSGRWYEKFQGLLQFRQCYGHIYVASGPRSKNASLYQWVKRQRYQYKLKQAGKYSTMTDERESALEQLGFVWDSHSAFWEERLIELHAFREKHGHCNVPIKYPENPQLAIWAKCQRRQFKLCLTEGAKRSNRTLERFTKLVNARFVFNPREMRKSSVIRAKAG
jgi:hypothetical protein